MKRLLLIILPFIVCTYASFIFSQQSCHSMMRPVAAKQIPFNHKSHVTKYGMTCEDCHGYYENGRFKGIPTVGDCVQCHDRKAAYDSDPMTPKRKAFFDHFKDTDIPWESNAKQADLVYFSHAVHMNAKYPDGRKKVRCSACHGNKEDSIDTKRITGMITMGRCEDCHRALKAPNTCLVCHD